MKSHHTALARACFVALALPVSAPAATLPSGHVFVYRVGDGVNALSGAAAPGVIEERGSDGTSFGTIQLPVAAGAGLVPVTTSGSGVTEGMIGISSDNQYLLVPGYVATPGTASVSTSTTSTISRVVARIDSTHAIDTTTQFTTAFSGGSIRSATSSNGTAIWAGGFGTGGGVWATTLGGTVGTQLTVSPANVRAVGIFGGQLYGSSATSGFAVGTVGTGLPTLAGQSWTTLPGETSTGSSQFALFDLSQMVAGLDTMYVAESSAPTGISKWTFNGVSWSLVGIVSFGGSAVYGLAGVKQPGGTVVLYATNGTTLGRIIDDGVTTWSTLTVTPIAIAPANTAYRGVAIASTTAPGAPVIGMVTGGNAQATINFTAPADDGGLPIANYTATCNPGGFTGASMVVAPITVSGLMNGVVYSCSVTATNSAGTGPASAGVMVQPSGSVATGCALDVDGNGTIDALTDGLLLLRAMFGLTGLQVTNGALGANATRGDWSSIRTFLNANCGTSFAP